MTDGWASLNKLLEEQGLTLDEAATSLNPAVVSALRQAITQQMAQEILSVQPLSRVPLTVGELQHACSTWYWVRPSYNPGGIFDYKETRSHIREIEEWITERCGPSGWGDPDGRWWRRDGKYIFRNEADRTMFVLKWS